MPPQLQRRRAEAAHDLELEDIIAMAAPAGGAVDRRWRHDANLSWKQRETLDLINRSGEHLLSLISLDAARIGEIIRHVSEQNPTLDDAMTNHAARLEYSTILQAV